MERDVRVEGHRRVRAPLHRVWQVLSRLESHPRFADVWMTADLLERSQASAVVEFRGFFGGLPITSVQRMVLRPPARIEFKQVRGTLRGLSGSYVLKDVDGDTDLGMSLLVDPGIVLFSAESARQILVSHIDSTLSRIKASAERDLVRVVPRRPSAAGAGRDLPAPPEVEPPEVDQELAPADAGEPEGEPEEEADEGVVAGERPEGAGAPAGDVVSAAPRRRRRRRRRRGGGPRRAPAVS